MSDILNDETFDLYAQRHYDNPQCFDILEFHEDMQRFKYIKRLFNKYRESDDLKERLILNHIVILNNVFKPVPTTRMLFFKLPDFHPQLKPFLIYLNTLPNIVKGIRNEPPINTISIPIDMRIVTALRNINGINHD